MSPGIEDVIGPEVWLALDQANARRHQIRRVVDALKVTSHWGMATERLGLARVYSGLFAGMLADKGTLRVPPGWCARRVWDRDAILIMPLWLAWLGDLWDGRWLAVRFAMRLGLWSVREGDYYVNGRLTAPRWLRRGFWCFINDCDRAPAIDAKVKFTTPAQRLEFARWVGALIGVDLARGKSRTVMGFTKTDPNGKALFYGLLEL